MTDNLQNAKQILHNEGYTCVLCNSNEIIYSTVRGVAPLLGWLESGKDFSSFCAADKVIGKAAAMLYVLLNIKEIYTDVISKGAIQTFEKYGVKYYFNHMTDMILNRTQSGYCPMEEATQSTNEPQLALLAIQAKLRQLKEGLK